MLPPLSISEIYSSVSESFLLLGNNVTNPGRHSEKYEKVYLAINIYLIKLNVIPYQVLLKISFGLENQSLLRFQKENTAKKDPIKLNMK